jgi:hypothetical protein
MRLRSRRSRLLVVHVKAGLELDRGSQPADNLKVVGLLAHVVEVLSHAKQNGRAYLKERQSPGLRG